jgi:hypothetical protein
MYKYTDTVMISMGSAQISALAIINYTVPMPGVDVEIKCRDGISVYSSRYIFGICNVTHFNNMLNGNCVESNGVINFNFKSKHVIMFPSTIINYATYPQENYSKKIYVVILKYSIIYNMFHILLKYRPC